MRQNLLTAVVVCILPFPGWALKIGRIGNPADIRTKTSFKLCLAGGGMDDSWSEGWRQLLTRSGGGDVVIIRSDGSLGGYGPWIYEDLEGHHFPKVNSVTTISIENRADANNSEVVQALRKAELIFFAGGQQNIYIDYLKNSKAGSAINYAMNVKRIPIGGTSAGMAILAGIIYTGRYNSPSSANSLVTSFDALKDPQGRFLDLESRILISPFMRDVITDTHLTERNRQGRLWGMMSKVSTRKSSLRTPPKIKAIGADEGTAFCYDRSGRGQVYGKGSMVFISEKSLGEKSNASKIVKVYQIRGDQPGSFFDLRKWQGRGGYITRWSVDNSNPEAPQLIQEHL